jgi:hypothetical protein
VISDFFDMGPLVPKLIAAYKFEMMCLDNLLVERRTADSPYGSCLHMSWMHITNGNRCRIELDIRYYKKSGQ